MTEQLDQNDELGSIQAEDPDTVEDFIRSLEAREKALDIPSDLIIEVSESDFDDMNVPAFILDELKSNSAGKTSAAPAKAPEPVAIDPRIGDLQNEIDELKKKITSLVTEKAILAEKTLTQMSDFENLKKRMERERIDTFNRQLENLAMKMLPVLDNLDRAVEFSNSIAEERKPELKQFFDGIILVTHQLNDIFAGMGVSPIVALGKEFNPEFHEAAAIVEDGTVPQNTIVTELLRGYAIGKRVIRHSMVKVSKLPQTPALMAQSGPEVPPQNSGAAAE